VFLVLRAFAAGCTALTGVEAISDGVLAFRPPEWKNARQTLLVLGVILGIMFLGITYLSQVYRLVPTEAETVLSLLSRQIFGGGSLLYYFLVLFATPTILLLAANTSYADFPRLCYFLARDGFLPRQLALLGDRLVYSNGILLLSICAAVLIVVFKGNTTAIIPFMQWAFSLHLRCRRREWWCIGSRVRSGAGKQVRFSMAWEQLRLRSCLQ